MLLDAIVLAGGRSSRLSGVPKSRLLWRGSTLLQNTVDAVLDTGARRVVVVGPGDGPAGGPSGAASTAPDAQASTARVLFAREDPPFGGPAAAVAAGMRALSEHEASGVEAVIVLACDMPGIAGAVAALVDVVPMLGVVHISDDASVSSKQGAIMSDSAGMRQPLAAVYRRQALADAVAGLRASGTLDGASMRSLISSLDLIELVDSTGSTRDVDTWNDAAFFGIEQPQHPQLHDEQRSRA
ncbi:molybdenum cofactor guanylyltransferase [Agreia sp.]|uniref:molybdenum cofactor guanylyltransferase n=1 Tax=Agreia sp. TaxID=1872416 RepID=UPI0035BBFAC0